MPVLKQLTGWSEKTVLEYCAAFRQLVASHITEFVQQDVCPEMYTYEGVQIGGDMVDVEIDESAFGKRKYNRGHYVETKWVFGGVEVLRDEYGRKKAGKFFAVVVEDRKRETLEAVIKKFIKPNSVIISDSWKAYDKIEDIPGYGYVHYQVNHSKNYVDPTSGACTNTIEAKWGGLKKAIPRQGFRADHVLQEYLAEQMWRNSNKGHLWEAIIVALKGYVNKMD